MNHITISLADPHGDRRQLGSILDHAVKRVLDSGCYILGPETADFERNFNHWLGHDGHCVGVASGTDAIEVALRTLGVQAGDAVITVSHTAVPTVAAIERLGAIPVLVDVELDTCCMNPQRLERAILWSKKNGLIPRAVVPVHLYGQPADMPTIMDIAEHEGLLVLEDCAQAHGATLNSQKVGTFGHAACFSFYPTKNLGAVGDGGMVRFRHEAAAIKGRKLREYGWGIQRFSSEFPGINSRLDELQAAILGAKLPYLDGWVARRRQIAAIYAKGLSGSSLSLPVCKLKTEHAYHLYVVRTLNRDGLRKHLGERGIGSGIHYPLPTHLMPAYANRVPVSGTMANTENITKSILSLPMHPHLTNEQLHTVCETVKAWEKENRSAQAKIISENGQSI